MKKSLLLAIACFSGIIAMANPITRQQAQQQALAFLSEKGKVAPNGMQFATRKARPSQDSESAYYYIFNVGNRSGYVVVSGDDRTAPILGYADQGEVSENEMPANMRAWFDEYAEQIKWMDEHQAEAAQPVSQARIPRILKTPVAPLLTSLWNQDAPYNLYCPTYNGERTVTGCVATAMAQVMYYHRNNSAERTTKTIPTYNTRTLNLSVGQLPVTDLNWDKMKDAYASSTSLTDASNVAVAKLMQYVGASVKMDYNLSAVGGSSAYSEDVEVALKTYFGYDKDVKVANRVNYTYAEWIDLIYAELSRGPVYYSGASKGGGDAFVCDGYAEDDFFHINWGWGGASNGYFRLSLLDPNMQGIGGSTSNEGFQFSQQALIDVLPYDDGIDHTINEPRLTTEAQAVPVPRRTLR